MGRLESVSDTELNDAGGLLAGYATEVRVGEIGDGSNELGAVGSVKPIGPQFQELTVGQGDPFSEGDVLIGESERAGRE